MTQDDLEDLPGVGPATAEKLHEAGYSTYKSVAVASPSELETDADIGESKAQKIIRSAQQEADLGGFETGVEVEERRSKIGKLQFFIEDVDELLGGGVETQSITETYGEFGAGKSQVTQQLAVNVQLPQEYGGLGGSCIFVDTEDTFRPNRIKQMVRGLDDERLEALREDRGIEGSIDNEETMQAIEESVLNNIHVSKAHNSNHQILLVEEAQELANDLEETDNPARLLVVDSLTNHFRSEYVGRGELANRQQKLNKHMHDILQFASVNNAAAIVTNQVQSNPDSYFGDPTKPVGGNIVGHTSTTRIYIRKSKEDKRILKLVDSPDLPDGEAPLRVTNNGLEDE